MSTEAEIADLVARYYRQNIGRLMQQAEHWAEHGVPAAVHYRLHKANAYYQVVALMESDPSKGWPLPFDQMRHALATGPGKEPGAYPPSAALERYRDPCFVAALLKPGTR